MSEESEVIVIKPECVVTFKLFAIFDVIVLASGWWFSLQFFPLGDLSFRVGVCDFGAHWWQSV